MLTTYCGRRTTNNEDPHAFSVCMQWSTDIGISNNALILLTTSLYVCPKGMQFALKYEIFELKRL